MIARGQASPAACDLVPENDRACLRCGLDREIERALRSCSAAWRHRAQGARHATACPSAHVSWASVARVRPRPVNRDPVRRLGPGRRNGPSARARRAWAPARSGRVTAMSACTTTCAVRVRVDTGLACWQLRVLLIREIIFRCRIGDGDPPDFEPCSHRHVRLASRVRHGLSHFRFLVAVGCSVHLILKRRAPRILECMLPVKTIFLERISKDCTNEERTCVRLCCVCQG